MHMSRRLAQTCSFLVTLAVACTAHSTVFRAYLSLSGNDANPCTLQAPCRLLPAALAAVNDGGEIWMLDSANYNNAPVVINKGVFILAIPGEMGSVLGTGGNAITIDAPGKTITLRNLQILNLTGGVNGVAVLDAAGVHIEKTSINGFNSDASSCIRVDPVNTTRVYVVDTFLRVCRNGVYATGPAAAAANRPSVMLDNVRIERGTNSSASTTTYGVWVQGNADVSIRNSMISREETAIQSDGFLANQFRSLIVEDSQILRSTNGIRFTNDAANSSGTTLLTRTTLGSTGVPLLVSNTAAGAYLKLAMTDSSIDGASSSVQISNTAPAVGTKLAIDMVRSTLSNISGSAIDLVASNGSSTYLDARDVTISHADTALRTSGTGNRVAVSLVRSEIHHVTTAIDHGLGEVRLDGNHIVQTSNTFVNSGSNDIKSLGNNMVIDFDNATAGLTYITPVKIPPQ